MGFGCSNKNGFSLALCLFLLGGVVDAGQTARATEPQKPAEPQALVSATPGRAGLSRLHALGCFAEADVNPDQLKGFRGRSAPGRIVLTDATGKSFALEISLRGLEQALDSLSKRS